MKKVIILKVMLIAILSMTACDNEDSLTRDSGEGNVRLTEVAWKFDGFGTVGEDEVRKGEPLKNTNYVTSYKYGVITFYEDGTLKGYAFVNEVYGSGYETNGCEFIEKTHTFGGTKIAGPKEEDEFWNAFCKLTHFKLEGTQLKLFYNNGQQFLLFHELEQNLENYRTTRKKR